MKLFLYIPLAGYVIFFCLSTFDRVMAWENYETMIDDLLKKRPNDPMIFNYQGYQKQRHGDYLGATADFSKSVLL